MGMKDGRVNISLTSSPGIVSMRLKLGSRKKRASCQLGSTNRETDKTSINKASAAIKPADHWMAGFCHHVWVFSIDDSSSRRSEGPFV